MEIHTHVTSTKDSSSSIAEAALCCASFIKTSPLKLLLHIPKASSRYDENHFLYIAVPESIKEFDSGFVICSLLKCAALLIFGAY